jgi:hypothetical protein
LLIHIQVIWDGVAFTFIGAAHIYGGSTHPMPPGLGVHVDVLFCEIYSSFSSKTVRH